MIFAIKGGILRLFKISPVFENNADTLEEVLKEPIALKEPTACMTLFFEPFLPLADVLLLSK